MSRRSVGCAAVLALLVVAVATAGTAGAATSPKSGWSLKFTGGITGTAKAIKAVSCTQTEPSGNQLNPTANFKVGKSSYQIQIRFDPPVSAGSRPFGHSASSSTVAINLLQTGNTKQPTSWTTGDGNGTGTVAASLKAGTINGQLVGLGSNGIAVTVKGKYSCPSFTP